MNRTSLRASSWLAVAVAAAQGLLAAGAVAKSSVPGVRVLPAASISLSASAISASQRGGRAPASLQVVLRNRGPGPLAVSPADFTLSSEGDIFGVHSWDAGRRPVVLAPRDSRAFRLTFGVPTGAMAPATLSFRAAGGQVSATVRLDGSPGGSATSSSPPPSVNTFYVTQGVGQPWGTAIDKAGNVWFAEPGCDFAPTCGASTAPGQIGEITAASHAVVFYTLPSIAGNQPIFLAFDRLGNLWFTTPDNSMIGEFSPATATFLGQWAVTTGSGPWDFTISGNRIWYTEHLVSAIGEFNTLTHQHRDFGTPSPNSNPYGIAGSGALMWFTENNSTVDRVAALNTRTGRISEYPIIQPLSGTPHMISIGAGGRPWWTEGWSNTIATLNPGAATPGQCGTTAGTCHGISRYALPTATACSTSSHVSGITFQASANLVWLDDALTAQVGSFSPSTATFAMTTLNNCNAHPHDGLALDEAHNVWFDEEFGSAIGELIP